MRGAAVELLIQRPVLVQHAVQNVCRDPPRRQARHLGWQSESLRGHEAGTFRKIQEGASRFAQPAGEGKTALAREYAKYKNPVFHFAMADTIFKRKHGI